MERSNTLLSKLKQRPLMASLPQWRMQAPFLLHLLPWSDRTPYCSAQHSLRRTDKAQAPYSPHSLCIPPPPRWTMNSQDRQYTHPPPQHCTYSPDNSRTPSCSRSHMFQQHRFGTPLTRLRQSTSQHHNTQASQLGCSGHMGWRVWQHRKGYT